jgi:hypothetical protein
LKVGRAFVFLSVAVLVLPQGACRRPKPSPDAAPPPASAAPAASSAAGEAPQRPAYVSRSGGFQDAFPDGKSPDVETADVTKGLSVRLFKVQYGSSAYLVTYDDAGKTSGRTSAQIVAAAKDGLLEATGGAVASERPVRVGDTEGTELVVNATTAGIPMRQHARLFVVSGRLYQIMVVSPAWAGTGALAEPFLASFALLPP